MRPELGPSELSEADIAALTAKGWTPTLRPDLTYRFTLPVKYGATDAYLHVFPCHRGGWWSCYVSSVTDVMIGDVPVPQMNGVVDACDAALLYDKRCQVLRKGDESCLTDSPKTSSS